MEIKENQLGFFKSHCSDSNGENEKIIILEKSTKNYYFNQYEAAKNRSRAKGERPTSSIWKNEGKKSKGIELSVQIIPIHDISSILREHVKFYSDLCKTEGWRENHGHLLTRLIGKKDLVRRKNLVR